MRTGADELCRMSETSMKRAILRGMGVSSSVRDSVRTSTIWQEGSDGEGQEVKGVRDVTGSDRG